MVQAHHKTNRVQEAQMQQEDKEYEQEAAVAPVGSGQVHPEVDHGQQDDRAQTGRSADRAQGLKNALVVEVTHHASEGTEESREDESPHVGTGSQRLRPFTAVLLPPFPSAGEAFTLEFLPFEKVPHAFVNAPALILTGILTATIAGSLLPLLEAIFRITTTVSWLELGDLNHPLLRRMTLEAPGTYHHSLMVANLAESAAAAIGANATICRVCSLYHDIGKLNKPEYYIENTNGEENPHDDLTPSMSALVVIAHVKDGVDLALKHKLNHEIIDVIQQHHGNSLIYFFYRRALDQQEEIRKLVAEGKASPEEVPEVPESSYRYAGPKPDFNESAIISLADAVESASRSLSKPTPAKIEALVEDIIRSRVRDGQLDDCDLTMSDLKAIRDSFTKTLRTALHRRIPYPDEKDGKDSRPKDETKSTRREPMDRERDRPRSVPRPATTIVPKQANT